MLTNKTFLMAPNTVTNALDLFTKGLNLVTDGRQKASMMVTVLFGFFHDDGGVGTAEFANAKTT